MKPVILNAEVLFGTALAFGCYIRAEFHLYICILRPFIKGQLQDPLFWERGCVINDDAVHISLFPWHIAHGHKQATKSTSMEKKTDLLKAPQYQYARGTVLQ